MPPYEKRFSQQELEKWRAFSLECLESLSKEEIASGVAEGIKLDCDTSVELSHSQLAVLFQKLFDLASDRRQVMSNIEKHPAYIKKAEVRKEQRSFTDPILKGLVNHLYYRYTSEVTHFFFAFKGTV